MDLNNQENNYQKTDLYAQGQANFVASKFKKPFYKRIWFIITIILISIAIIFFGVIMDFQKINSRNVNNNNDKVVQSSTTIKPVPNENAFKEKLISVFNNMAPNLKVYDISFNTNDNKPVVTIKITWSGLGQTLSLCKTYGYVPDNYLELLDKFSEASLIVKNSANQYNYEDLSCNLIVLNDLNPNNTLIATKDGKVVYDWVTN